MIGLFRILVIIVAVIIGLLCISKNDWTWDNICYSGAILSLENDNKEEIHREVVKSIRETTNKQLYKSFFNSSYTATVLEDPESLSQLLGAYKFKLLYVCSSYILYKMGIPLALCSSYISVLFFILTSFLIFHSSIVVGKLKPPFAFFICLLFLCSDSMRFVATLATPDMMSCFFLLFSAYFIILKRSKLIITLFLILAILTRPDNIIFAVYAMAITYLLEDFKNKKLIIASGLTLMIGTYILLNLYIDYPGWSLWFYHAFILKLNYPLTEPSTITGGLYFSTLIERIPSFAFPFLILMLLFYSINKIKSFVKLSFQIKIILLCIVLTVVTRFFLFPYWATRFYFPYYLMLGLVIIYLLRDKKILLESN